MDTATTEIYTLSLHELFRSYVANRQVDQQTGTILVQALFPNPDAILRPGLYAKVRAPTVTTRGALLVPQRAVQEPQGVCRASVAGAEAKAGRGAGKVGARADGVWTITRGLR